MNTTIIPRSRTLLRLEKVPDTICAICPNAVWHTVKKGGQQTMRAYCKLMHALIDNCLGECDGMPDDPAT